MKELYTSPEVKLIGFVAAERIANLELDFSDFLDINLTTGNTTVSKTDIKLPTNS